MDEVKVHAPKVGDRFFNLTEDGLQMIVYEVVEVIDATDIVSIEPLAEEE